MSFAKVYSAQTTILRARLVTVEVDLSKGLHSFSVVGLPDKAVEEAKDRISAAIKNSGFKSPKQRNQKVVVSLAPADLPKEGSAFDLAIALAYLLATGEVRFETRWRLFLGELSLDGFLRPLRGVLPLIREAKERGYREVFLPKENECEAALIRGMRVFGAQRLNEVIAHLDERHRRSGESGLAQTPETAILAQTNSDLLNLSDIKAQESAKRGLEIAAAGGHNISFSGPPGTGKTMLAKALPSILPPLSFEEVLEVTAIHSVAGILQGDLITIPPFRAPHHTASYVAVVGGGGNPKPGEVTLSHRGVLFLDEFPEFDRRVIEALRQPLEEGLVAVSRAKGSARFPAQFILVATLNPCPCGYWGSKEGECTCTPQNLLRYQRKLSGPIIDRIDMWIEVPNVPHLKLSESSGSGETSEVVRERVKEARRRQRERFNKARRNITVNSEMTSRDLERFVPLSNEVRELLNNSAEKLRLSARGYHRTIKLSRTIADLLGKEKVEGAYILEALQYRPKINYGS